MTLSRRPVCDSPNRAGRRSHRSKGDLVSTPDETYRATMRVQTPEHGPATLIVTRQGSRTWLTLEGSIRSTAVLTDQQVAELTTKLRTNTR